MLENLQLLWKELFELSLMEMTASHLILLTIILVGGFTALKVIGKRLKEGSSTIFASAKKLTKGLSAKERASHFTCSKCGRTLDKCVCPSNKDLSFSKRIKKYKLEQKARKILNKQ